MTFRLESYYSHHYSMGGFAYFYSITINRVQVKDLKFSLTQALIDTDTASGARQVIDGEPPVAFLAAVAGESS